MLNKFLLAICFALINSCTSNEMSTYTAAVVELNPLSDGSTDESVVEMTKQVTEIFESNAFDGVDIVVLPEAIFNRQNTAITIPNTNVTYCDDKSVHFVLRNMSCMARNVKKYIVIDIYAKVDCSRDDQAFCSNQTDSTNLYNMAMVFNRHGDVVAKYRKYHLFNEVGVQQTAKPDSITFRTDFNVTFGVCTCFDLMFDEPVIGLVEQGVKNFVYPTMWFSEIPYLTAVQYQQSWAYANNVNLLAANVNWPSIKCSGSGIYAGRSGALKLFVSESPKTKILIAKIPCELPTVEHQLSKSQSVSYKIGMTSENQRLTHSTFNLGNESNDDDDIAGTFVDYVKNGNPEKIAPSEIILSQDDLSEFSVRFLNFSENPNQYGMVCNNAICCNYTIQVDDNGETDGKSTYYYAISVFSGHRHYKTIKNLVTGQEVCSLIACTELGSKSSCGIRLAATQVQHRYIFTKLMLETTLSRTYMKVMPNTLTSDLLPLTTSEFEYKLFELNDDKYVVALNLTVPKSNLLTFAIFSRDYDKDMFSGNNANAETHGILLVLCASLSLGWIRYGSSIE